MTSVTRKILVATAAVAALSVAACGKPAATNTTENTTTTDTTNTMAPAATDNTMSNTTTTTDNTMAPAATTTTTTTTTTNSHYATSHGQCLGPPFGAALLRSDVRSRASVMGEPLDWTGDTPRSPRFDDIYFSPADGLAEAQAVFLQGCGLPEAWAERRHFTVGELGFGAGLNVLALIDLWRQTRPDPNAVLQVFSIEGFIMSREDAARALIAWPQLSDIASRLLAQWPGGRTGFHRMEWPEHGVILDLSLMEAEAALSAWSGFADAWFLDGFAPSKNPEMWRPEVLHLIGQKSRRGACASTFSVAGAVRRGLQAAGFEIVRAPGFGRKKERLEARLGPDAREPASACSFNKRVAVIGAGIAGAALARAFRRLGCAVSVFEAESVGAGGSGNPSALVTPRLDAGLGSSAELYAQAFTRAVQLYRRETPDAIIAQGALQLAVQPRDPARFEKIAGWTGFDPGAVSSLNSEQVSVLLTEPVSTEALELHDALVIEPAVVLESWLADAYRRLPIARIERNGVAWRLIGQGGETAGEADILCLAAGPAIRRLTSDLPLIPVRGQASFTDAVSFTGMSSAFGGYAIPTRDGFLFGATHDREDWGRELRAEDDDRNLHALRQGRPQLADRVTQAPLSSRASLRAMTPDHLPLAGQVADQPGLFILSGFGARGFTLAPLLAEAVAADALGAPSPLPLPLAKLVDPRRFREPKRTAHVPA